MKGRWPAWVVAPLLAAPLVVFTAWITYGWVTAPKAGGPSAAQASAGPAPAGPAAPASAKPAFAVPPDEDLPADRLEERVDGGAEALRADGCRRLLHWRFEQPPADAEALVFKTEAGAKAVLAREAGSARTPGPGDEAQLSAQAAYFRRGSVYVRIFLDPGAEESPELGKRAAEIDRMLVSGGAL